MQFLCYGVDDPVIRVGPVLDFTCELFVEKVCFMLIIVGYFSVKYDRYIEFVFGLFVAEEVEGCP